MLARIHANSPTARIIEDVNILMANQWVHKAWKEVTGKLIKSCFEKCRVVKRNEDLIEIEGDDLEFEAFVRELRPDMSTVEYVCFDPDIPTPEPMINEHEVDW